MNNCKVQMHTVITCIKHMHAAVLTGTTVAMVRSLLLLRQREKQLRLSEFDSGVLYLSSFPGQVVDQSLQSGEITPPPHLTSLQWGQCHAHTHSHTHLHTHKAMFPQVTPARPITEEFCFTQYIYRSGVISGNKLREKRKEGKWWKQTRIKKEE